eukprot:9192947-Pyramimonas_sp.AAC.1
MGLGSSHVSILVRALGSRGSGGRWAAGLMLARETDERANSGVTVPTFLPLELFQEPTGDLQGDGPHDGVPMLDRRPRCWQVQVHGPARLGLG